MENNKDSSKTVRFIIHDHNANKAGYHQDLRFEIPNSKNWMSFAVPKGVPLKPGKRVLAIRTHDHTEREAMFVGNIPVGEYGAGSLKVFDEGICIIQKFTSAHMILSFMGFKVKGIYHLVSIGNVDTKKYKQQQYMLFKSKSM